MKDPTLLLIFIGLFVMVLILRMIKAYLLAKRLNNNPADLPENADKELKALISDVNTPQKAREVIRRIGEKAHGIKSAKKRGAYYCTAGNLLISQLKRPNAAIGLYLKALRADPSCLAAISRLQEILTAQKRFRRLKRAYWEVLARLDEGECGEEMWITCWTGLAALYAASPKTIRRADAIRKALSAFDADIDEDELNAISKPADPAP